jgi:hypothetical protein
LRIGGLNNYDVALLLHLLLLRAFQVSRFICLTTQRLHRVHDCFLLRQERIAQFLGPVEFFAHHSKNVGERNERFHTVFPGLFIQSRIQGITFKTLVLFHPSLRLHHLEGIRRGHEDLSQDVVGVKRDGRQQLIEFLLLEHRFRLLLSEDRIRQNKANRRKPDYRVFP